MGTAETFGKHFFTCRSVPRCEIGDDPSQDYFCPEGERLKWELFRSTPDPEDRAYLLHLADEYMEAEWKMRAVSDPRLPYWNMGGENVGGAQSSGDSAAYAASSTAPAPPTTLIPGEYNSDDLDRLVR